MFLPGDKNQSAAQQAKNMQWVKQTKKEYSQYHQINIYGINTIIPKALYSYLQWKSQAQPCFAMVCEEFAAWCSMHQYVNSTLDTSSSPTAT